MEFSWILAVFLSCVSWLIGFLLSWQVYRVRLEKIEKDLKVLYQDLADFVYRAECKQEFKK